MQEMLVNFRLMKISIRRKSKPNLKTNKLIQTHAQQTLIIPP